MAEFPPPPEDIVLAHFICGCRIPRFNFRSFGNPTTN